MPAFSSAIKEYNHRIVVLGDYAVGKSSIVVQYVKNEFNEKEESTIGAAFMIKTILNRGNYIKFEIWDTAGQEKFNSLIPMYYRGAQAALIVYDITSKRSFNRAKEWVRELAREKPKEFLKILVGNKIDLESCREVLTDEGEKFAKENNLLFYETSAKTHSRIDDIFTDIAGILPRNDLEDKSNIMSSGKGGNRFGCC